jgi:hypothetical protein
MRNLPPADRHAVVSLHEREKVPHGFNWEYRDRRIATGSTWVEVLEKLDAIKNAGGTDRQR